MKLISTCVLGALISACSLPSAGLCLGCGGAPFEASIEGAPVLAENTPDSAGVSPDSGGAESEPPDAVQGDSQHMTVEAAVKPDGDGGADAHPEAEADAPAADSSPDTAPACTPFAPHGAWAQCSGSKVPEEFCTGAGGKPTPSECQCQESYTCACLVAHGACTSCMDVLVQAQPNVTFPKCP